MQATQQVITEASDGGKLRLTFGVVSMWDLAHYNVYRREGWAWLESLDLTALPKEDDPPVANDLRLAVIARAQTLAALKTVETQAPDSEEWQPGELPEEWTSVDGYLRNIPGSITNVWHKWTLLLNPTVFLNHFGDAEKNGGAVIVV